MRVLPLTMIAVCMLLAIKVAAVMHGGEEIARLFWAGSVAAQQEKTDAKSADTKPAEKPAEKKDARPADVKAPPADAKVAEKKPDGEAVKGDKPAEGEKKTETPAEAVSKEGDKKPAEGEGEKKEGEKKEGEKKEPDKLEPGQSTAKGEVSDVRPGADESPDGGKGLAPGSRYFSPTELDILQNLSKRHEQLETWEKNIELKETLMGDIEKRIDTKITQIENMQQAMKELILQYNAQEDSKIKSLVKIYEAMKPTAAARIFDEVEMPILLLVIDKMAEKKVAPILAAMDSKKAKQLTVDLAERRRLQGIQLGAACIPNVQPPPAQNPAPAP